MTAQAGSANERLKAILKAGKLFEGKYRILRPLGAGSFAVVVHARHEVMGRNVALKFLKPKVVDTNPEVSERFVKEVQIASRLNHPNVVAIYDFGVTDDGIYYMVQEFVDGSTVDELLPEGRPMEQQRVLYMVNSVLDCLCEAHSQGIIHRDLKPSNLMSTRGEDGEEVIKILDFGVAKLLESDGTGSPASQIRQSTKFIGTPIYMSPEQILGREVSPASDLYSVGLMLYEMLTGQPPIQAEQIAEVVQQHLSDSRFEFPMLHLLESNLQRVILKATSREVEERYTTAEHFMKDLAMDEGLEEFSHTSVMGGDELGHFMSDNTQVSESPANELDVFLGKNYIGLDDDEDDMFSPLSSQEQRAHRLGSTGEFSVDDIFGSSDPLPPMASPAPSIMDSIPFESARPAPTPEKPAVRSSLSARPPKEPSPSSSGMHRVESDRPSVTQSQMLELDMDAMRSVRDKRPKERIRHEYDRDDAAGSTVWDFVLVILGGLACFVTCIMLCAVTGGMAAPVRILGGLSPLVVSVVLAAIQSSDEEGLMQRWLEPVAVRVMIMGGISFVVIALISSSEAAVLLREEGAWLFSSMPKSQPFLALGKLSQSLANIIAGILDVLAKVIPW